MGLTRKNLCPGPTKKPTKEEKERIELAWKILCEKGSVNIMDPLDMEDIDIKEMLRKDPHAIFEYHSEDGTSYDEFVKRIMAGDHDEK